MICSGLKIVVPLLWSNVVERTLACIYQNWQPSAMTLLTTTSVGRNRNSSEGSLRSPSSKRSWTSVGRNRNSSEGSLRSPSSLKSDLITTGRALFPSLTTTGTWRAAHNYSSRFNTSTCTSVTSANLGLCVQVYCGLSLKNSNKACFCK